MKAIIYKTSLLVAAGFLMAESASSQFNQHLALNEAATISDFSYQSNKAILKTCFLDEVLNTANTQTAVYYQTIQPAGEMGYLLNTYFITGELKMTGYSKEPGFFSPHGTFVFYYQNGAVESVGNYRNGVKAGVWQRFAPDGKEKAERVYTGIPVEHYFETIAFSYED